MESRIIEGEKVYKIKEKFKNDKYCVGCVKYKIKKISCEQINKLFNTENCSNIFVNGIYFLKEKRF